MPIYNVQSYLRIPKTKREAMVHYPDVILFDLNAGDYVRYWESLSQSQYLATNGYHIYPTHWLDYAWQTFKGWLGFTNDCHPETLYMSLHKLAYYGYLAGYDQRPLDSMLHYPLNPNFLCQAKQKRNDNVTVQMQKHLTNHYLTTSLYQHSYQRPSHSFGSTWETLGFWQAIPALDPQDLGLIQRTVSHLVTNSEQKYPFISCSRYTAAAVEFYIAEANNAYKSLTFMMPSLSNSQAKMRKCAKAALDLDPLCTDNDLELFIEYYLLEEQYDKAYELIARLPSVSKALKYLKDRFSPENLRRYVPKDSPLGLQLGRYYLEKKDVGEAVNFVSDLNTFSPEHSFPYLVKQKQWYQAYQVFVDHKHSVTFEKNALKELANFFVKEGETTQQRAAEAHKVVEDTQNWDEMTELYFQSMKSLDKAHQLYANDDISQHYHKYFRHYIQYAIEAQFAQPAKTNIETIYKHLETLKKHMPDKKDKVHHEYIKLYVQGLMRCVDHHIKLVKVSATYHADKQEPAKHKAAHQSNFDKLFQDLES
ncbi:MAG: hypothetical protein EPN84_05095, partial [Legionella sp.]